MKLLKLWQGKSGHYLAHAVGDEGSDGRVSLAPGVEGVRVGRRRELEVALGPALVFGLTRIARVVDVLVGSDRSTVGGAGFRPCDAVGVTDIAAAHQPHDQGPEARSRG